MLTKVFPKQKQNIKKRVLGLLKYSTVDKNYFKSLAKLIMDFKCSNKLLPYFSSAQIVNLGS